jgi:hypothetical protein
LRLKQVAQLHDIRAKEAQNQQKLQHDQQGHMQKMVHTAQEAKIKQEILKSQPKPSGKTGKATK